jgi:plasmid stabilization system protein ParE
MLKTRTRRRRRKLDDGIFVTIQEPPLPPPTAARPGSEEKIDILTRRLERGEALFHPADERVSVHRIRHARREIA